MYFIALCMALLIVFFLQRHIYRKYIFAGMNYRVTVSAEEVFEGDDVYIYEELSNDKALPVPNAKVEAQIPDGLALRLLTDDGGEQLCRSVQSIFVLGSHRVIKRRWRIKCLRRGVYNFGSALVVTNDLFGMDTKSKRLIDEPAAHNRVVVLPKIVRISEEMTPSLWLTGGKNTMRSIHTDPLMIAGSREYTLEDPMNRINWKSTAVHNQLMVNIEEFTRRGQFNLVLNMQTRSPEKDPTVPASPDHIERCITAAASLIDHVADEDSPLRLYINTPPESIEAVYVEENQIDDPVAKRILVTRLYHGKRDFIDALRLLADIKMKISVTTEQLMDTIAAAADYYCGGGDLIMVSSYIDARMLNFREVMRSAGVNVIFMLTTTYTPLSQHELADAEIHYLS
ncbi:MAG: DUF58 domain-containing protein [Clostridiales bacterium]|nr:DUF58 domain-containing protein [Clostridiales bacterium]